MKIDIQRLEEWIPVSAFHSATIVYNIQRIKEILKELKSSISINKIIPTSFIEYFALKTPCESSCPLYTNTNPKLKLYKQDDKYFINLDFDLQLFEKDLVMQKADPFNLITTKDNETCLLEYNGPGYVILNTTSTEICDVTEDVVKEKFIMFMTGTFCHPPKPIEWKLTNCVENTTQYAIRKPQTKIVNDNFYIYCFGHSIRMYNHSTTCTNEILKISRNMEFAIGDNQYSFDRYALVAKHTVDGLSNQINWKMSFFEQKLNVVDNSKIKALERITLSLKTTKKSWTEYLKEEIINVLIMVITGSLILMIIS